MSNKISIEIISKKKKKLIYGLLIYRDIINYINYRKLFEEHKL